MSIFANIYRYYVCDSLGMYISLVINFLGSITPYWSTLIDYPHHHIDNLTNDLFKSIDRSSCQPVGFQATPPTLRDMKYVRTPF